MHKCIDAIYRWTFIDVAHENTSLVFRDTRRTMAIDRESTTNQTLVTRVLWTTCWHHCISLSIRSISRIVQLYWFNFNPYFFVLEGWQIKIRLFLKDSGGDNETCVHKFFLKFSNRWVFDRVIFSLITNVIDRNFKNY